MVKEKTEGKHGFDEIYADFHEKIHRYLARQIGENETEDVTQEVFLKINAALDNFRGESSLSTWIYRIATNAAMDHLRRGKLNKTEHIEDERLNDDTALLEDKTSVTRNEHRPDKQLIRKEMNACIRGIADSLPEAYRTCLILSDFEELSNNEIAAVLNVSLETVKIRLHRARARLKKELEHHCSFYRDERNELACDRKTLPLQFNKNRI